MYLTWEKEKRKSPVFFFLLAKSSPNHLFSVASAQLRYWFCLSVGHCKLHCYVVSPAGNRLVKKIRGFWKKNPKKQKQLNENERFLFSPLYQSERERESKGTDCTLLMCSFSLTFVSIVIKTAGVFVCERVTEMKAIKFLLSVHVILGQRCSVIEAFLASLILPWM